MPLAWRRARSLKVVLLTGVLTLVLSTPALACGGMVSEDGSAELDAFTALLSHDGATEELLVTVGYAAQEAASEDGPGFAWMMPLPAAPEITEADAAALRAALDITEPPRREDHVPSLLPGVCACGAANDGAGGGLDVDRTVVGPFEFVTLRGGSTGSVQGWMGEHGFAFHDRQSPAVQAYLDRGWVLVTARVLPGVEPEGDLTPVRFRFESGDPVYPLALAGSGHQGQVIPMSLFTVTPYRPAATSMPEDVVEPDDDGEFASPGNLLELRYSAPLSDADGRDLAVGVTVPDGSWLTRYEASWQATSLTEDLVFGRASSQTAIDYEALLDRYAAARKWSYVGRGVVLFFLITPLVLAVSGLVVLVAGLAGGGFRKRPQPPAEGSG